MPLLGDLPLVGTLFATEHANRAKRELYIVVTPHVATTGVADPEPIPKADP